MRDKEFEALFITWLNAHRVKEEQFELFKLVYDFSIRFPEEFQYLSENLSFPAIIERIQLLNERQ